jgi:hypothetical protein
MLIFQQFKAHDRSHCRSSEIYAEIDRLTRELVEHGHTFDASWITRPLKEDESIESVLCGQSEKLAIVFNLFIDRATKLIAKIRKCEIVVRDTNRIHHFYPNGTCSCQDHF